MIKPCQASRKYWRFIGVCSVLLVTGAWAWGGQVESKPASATPAETVYVCMYGTQQTKLRGRNPVVGIFFTRDQGKTWRHIGWTQGKTVGVAVAPGSGGATLFAAGGNGVLRSTDGGRFWRIMTGWQITEVQDVTINPRQPRQVFAATAYGIFRSDDDGAIWEESDLGLPEKFVSTVHFDPARSGRIWAGTEAGLFRSDDGGRHWQPTSITVPVRSIRHSTRAASTWAIATVGRGVAISEDHGESWRYADGEMAAVIYRCEFDPHDGNRLYAGGWNTGMLVSDDRGRTWRATGPGLGSESIHGIAVSRQVGGLVFAGTMGEGVFVSADAGGTWQPVDPGTFKGGQIWDISVEEQP